MDTKKELLDYISQISNQNASDLHLMVGSKPFYRLDRELLPFIQKEILTEEDVNSFLSILINDDKDQMDKFKKEKKLLFSYKHEQKEETLYFRVTAYKEQGNTAIAMRLIKNEIKTFEELNLPPILKNVMGEKQGLFLVVGPTGNGKSTALASMINYLNQTQRKHILTIEDPIEYVFKREKSLISQREVPADTPSFKVGLETALRTDADVIMIGEMRGTDTMSIGITSAEVGHLVLSTIHANSASSTINRIIDSFPAEQQNQIANQLSTSLIGVCSVRLLPRQSGGLIPAVEVMLNTSAIANLIRENRIQSIDSAIQTGSGKGMISLDQSLADLVSRGEITLDVAKKFSNDEKILMRYI